MPKVTNASAIDSATVFILVVVFVVIFSIGSPESCGNCFASCTGVVKAKGIRARLGVEDNVRPSLNVFGISHDCSSASMGRYDPGGLMVTKKE
jgi:hypothetical protein